MRPTDPAVRNLARQLLARERPTLRNAADIADADRSTYTKLRVRLVNVVGLEGFRVLLVRALALAKAEVAWLEAVQVKSDGDLEGLHEAAAIQDAAEAIEGSVALLAQVFGLLVNFIGETLTLRLARGIWPETPRDEMLSGSTEEAKG